MADKGIQVIDRAFDIIEILSFEKDGLGVTEIGTRLGLHKSTVHRILTAMAQRGYIEKVPDKTQYRLGLKLIEISSIYLNNIELKTEAKPYLTQLMLEMSQPVHLATLDNCDVVYIDKVETVNSIRLYSQIGRRVPSYCSALGKCLLSGLDDRELDETLSQISFRSFTEHTLKTKKELKRQIVDTKTKGWAIDDEEHELGVRCIAAPITDYRGKIIAAISVSAPIAVLTKDACQEVAEKVMSAAGKISLRLGGKG